MTEQEQKPMSIFDLFASSQETFEEAKKKSSEETSRHASYLRFTQDGTYTVRILPLAPILDANGKPMPLERKGYEYPLRSLTLKIEGDELDAKGKPKISYVNVCNAKYAFPELKADLIDTYVQTACEMFSSDEKLCKVLRSTSFNGGLKWDSRRCMYVLDLEKPGDGIQILQLSYSQYKDLEERKLNIWNKLMKNGQVSCPISSHDAAYPLEITRKTENGKTSYSFNIDTLTPAKPLDEDTLQTLFDTPRLPDVLYRYTRFHLEATIAFLKQVDLKHEISVVNSEAVQNCIEQIKLLLPADDQSHFAIGHTEDTENNSINDLDALWDRLDKIADEGLDDKSAEGQELRTAIKEYIENNQLGIKITRSKTNETLLNEIEDQLDPEKGTEEAPAEEPTVPEEEAPARHIDFTPEETPVEEDEEEEPEDDEPTTPHTRTRNDDTNEPAAQPVHSRRGARPTRRR